MVKQETKEKWSLWLTVLKTGTYALIGFIGDGIVQALSGGMDFKQSLIVGVSVGLISGLKNFVKVKFDTDLDLTKLAK